MSNRLEFLIALSGLGPGVITIYVPTWLLLRHIPGLDRKAFLETFPQKRLPLTLHEIATLLTFLLAAPLLTIILGNNITPRMRPFFFFCCFFNSIGVINGIFESITGICPKRGINLRLSHKQSYVYHPGVRKTGLLRLGLGIFFVGASLVLFHTNRLLR